MDIHLACIICNWYDGLGGIGLGLGASGAAAAAASTLGLGSGESSQEEYDAYDAWRAQPYPGFHQDRDPNADDVGDVTPRPPVPQSPVHDDLLKASEVLQKWAEGLIGVDVKGTAPTAHLM
jgi:hypothetical protein